MVLPGFNPLLLVIAAALVVLTAVAEVGVRHLGGEVETIRFFKRVWTSTRSLIIMLVVSLAVLIILTAWLLLNSK